VSTPAAERLRELAASIARLGHTPVSLLTGGDAVEPGRHYPDGDMYDCGSYAQAYFHVHRAGEHGHLHLFQRPKGMAVGLVPAVPTTEADAPCHLVAVGFGADGWPDELFTTNRWVTGEAWYDAGAVAVMLPMFRLMMDGRLATVAAWVTALVNAHRPAIVRLARDRDAAVADWACRHPDRSAHEDAGLEVTSCLRLGEASAN
jgi:hypothetical protein